MEVRTLMLQTPKNRDLTKFTAIRMGKSKKSCNFAADNEIEQIKKKKCV